MDGQAKKSAASGTGYWVGGNTKVYGAALFRLRQEDFGVLHHKGEETVLRRTMYYTESFRYAIFAYDFDPATGTIANRRTFSEISAANRKAGGFPDGMSVDTERFVWSNQVGLKKIVRYDPEGKIERVEKTARHFLSPARARR